MYLEGFSDSTVQKDPHVMSSGALCKTPDLDAKELQEN